MADLFLDTLPCNAHTTTSDALRMGLPVLTLMGESFAARVAASLLNAVNLPELITTSQEQYESLAIELARHPEKLKALKEKLARNLPTAPLYDTSLFTKHLELAYITMVDRHQKGLVPDHIYVEQVLPSANSQNVVEKNTLSEEAKAQLQSLQFVDQELAKLQAQAAVLQTARIAYAKALNDALGTELVFNG